MNDAYKHRAMIGRVDDVVGADVPRDVLKIALTEQEIPINVTVTNEELDVSGGTVPVDHQGVIDVSNRDDRNLGNVDVTALPDADRGDWNGAELSADGSVSIDLSAVGADRLRGRVASSGSYDVTVAWLAEDGTELFTEEVAVDVAADEETDVDLLAVGAQARLTIDDKSSAAQTVTGVAHLA